MPIMINRLLQNPDQSILLFGPRGTGKSTWIHHHFKDAVIYDLLNTSESLRFTRESEALYREVEAVPAERWIVIDEVQDFSPVRKRPPTFSASESLPSQSSLSGSRSRQNGQLN